MIIRVPNFWVFFMMKPQIYRTKDIGPGLLSVMAKPVAGEWLDEDFRFYKDSGISLIVSLLEDMEAFELGLQGEKEIAERHGIAFLSFPVADRGLPESFFGFKAFVSSLHHQIKGGAHAAVQRRGDQRALGRALGQEQGVVPAVLDGVLGGPGAALDHQSEERL